MLSLAVIAFCLFISHHLFLKVDVNPVDLSRTPPRFSKNRILKEKRTLDSSVSLYLIDDNYSVAFRNFLF